MKLKLNIKGFTLVELILVVGIIAILFTVAFMVLNPLGQFQKANDSKRKSDLAQIQRALESYYQDNERYPRTTGAPSYCLQHIVSPWSYYCGNSNWSPYMNLVPKDPKSSNRYVYYVSSDGQSYYIYANLERGMKDPQVCNADGSGCDSLTTNSISATACGGTCNYGVSSPNVSP